MKGGIALRADYKKQSFVDSTTSLIECRLLGRGEAKLSELYKADHYISRWRRKLFELPFIRC